MTINYKLDEIKKISSFIIKNSITNYYFFKGKVGVGKTTLIKQICNDLGCNENVNSPTFSLVNEYIGNSRLIIHMDLFRLKNKEELVDLGILEYLDKINSLLIIEWPEILLENILISHTLIELRHVNKSERKISLKNIQI
tara:strand:+ start:16652 stop:17071 length:420 start_codon:yes stop_codon:yes gene_type:complete